MTRKRYIKLMMSLLYQRNEAVDQANYINQMMKKDKKTTYAISWSIFDEYDRYFEEVFHDSENERYE